MNDEQGAGSFASGRIKRRLQSVLGGVAGNRGACSPTDVYANFMMEDEGEAQVKAAYGDNYGRLATVKKKYDRGNLFHVNQNIRPAA